jgi:hypothetical protein
VSDSPLPFVLGVHGHRRLEIWSTIGRIGGKFGPISELPFVPGECHAPGTSELRFAREVMDPDCAKT